MAKRKDPLDELDRALWGVRAITSLCAYRGSIRLQQIKWLRKRLELALKCLDVVEKEMSDE